jgi:hypothetical protein
VRVRSRLKPLDHDLPAIVSPAPEPGHQGEHRPLAVLRSSETVSTPTGRPNQKIVLNPTSAICSIAS